MCWKDTLAGFRYTYPQLLLIFRLDGFYISLLVKFLKVDMTIAVVFGN